MKRLPIFFLFTSLTLVAFGQETQQQRETQQPKDTVGGQLPRLEIPEITIVGKKAITLPFARKGEIYDVNIYEAPPPDTSLLGERTMMSLPIGSLPRYEQQLDPWRLSAEGSFGSFMTGHVRGYLDYTTLRWGIHGNGGYRTTQGHADNASATSTQLELNARSLVITDNEILRSFRASGGLSFVHDEYGMFGIPLYPVRRKRNDFSITGRLGSVNRQGAVVDVDLGTSVLGITDKESTGDSNITVVSPTLRATVSSDLNAVRLFTELRYASSSLDYSHPTQSPSTFGFTLGARWRMTDQWMINVGGIYDRGSDNEGGDRTLVAPTAVITWERDRDRVWSFWYQPEIRLVPYDERSRQNPYLIRELAMRPERIPVNVGSTLKYNSEFLSVDVSGSFAHSQDRALEVADSGRIRLYYVDAERVAAQASGTLILSGRTRLIFSGTLQPTREAGTSTQLPMVPVLQLYGRGEIDLQTPVTIWSSIDYRSKRNIDLLGNRTLGDVAIVSAGLSTHVLHRVTLAFDITNIFNTAYEWWSGYSAPGRQLTLEAKINLK
ncbi:MAG: hypothetical protein HY033_05335 [Ignavibacteriae bacterium]|nr:hypothetical protein [Ignavibacteria bacterium]MBI3364312.1 hypothetical protein [Ignavibacteriota bacterium]